MGSVQRWKHGRYRAHWMNPDGKRQSKVFDYMADAKAWVDQMEADVSRGTYLSPHDRRMSFSEYVESHWLPAQVWRPSTREQFDSHYRAHLQPAWGSQPLGAIRRTAIQAWVNGLAERLAPRTVEAVYRRFVSIILAALDDGLIDRKPTSRIRLPARGSKSAEMHVPTAEEVVAITEAVADWYRPLVSTMATLGLRPGEAVGLTIERVNFLKREVTIDRQLATRVGVGPTFAPPKTGAAIRVLPAPQPLLDQLAAHLDSHGQCELEPGATLIFTGRTGTPIRRNNLADTWGRASRSIGLRPELRGWHSLRHFAITRLIAAGTNPDYVRQFAGHESLRETLEIYSGWWPSDLDEARTVLDSALKELAL